MMETLRVQLSAEKAKQVRETAMKRFGYSKGAISKAMTQALEVWLQQTETKTKPKAPNWKVLRGTLKDIKMNAVELQHHAFLFPAMKKKRTKKTD